MLGRLIKLGLVAGAGYAAWKRLSKAPAQPFFQDAMQAAVADIEAARSAQLRAASADLRAFAQRLEHEHGEHARDLSQAAGQALPALDARRAAELQAIDHLQGSAYDTAWLKYMAKGHRETIRLYEREVANGGAGGPLAEEALAHLRAHAQRIAELQAPAAANDSPATGEAGAVGAGFDGPRAAI